MSRHRSPPPTSFTAGGGRGSPGATTTNTHQAHDHDGERVRFAGVDGQRQDHGERGCCGAGGRRPGRPGSCTRSSQPAHDMTEAMGQPSTVMNEPLSSNAVAAMAAPSTPSRITRASTYIPVPPIEQGDDHLDGEVEAYRYEIPDQGREAEGGRLPVEGQRAHRARCTGSTGAGARCAPGSRPGSVQGMISRIRSEVWELWGAGGWACRRPKCWDRPSRFSWSKGPERPSVGQRRHHHDHWRRPRPRRCPRASGSQRRVRLGRARCRSTVRSASSSDRIRRDGSLGHADLSS